MTDRGVGREALSDRPKFDFTTAPEVLARLTYTSDGKPIVLAAGKVRDREADLNLIMDWLQALKAQIVSAVSSTTASNQDGEGRGGELND